MSALSVRSINRIDGSNRPDVLIRATTPFLGKRHANSIGGYPSRQGARSEVTFPSLAVTYSTPRADAVAEFVAAHYALPGPLQCTLLRRGFNDTFEVRAADGERLILRLSARRARGESDVASETAFLAHLDKAGVPVAAAVPARDGTLHAMTLLPEGRRPAVLFKFAEGRAPQINSPADARANGVTLAHIHAAAEGFASAGSERYRLDLDHLLRRPLAAIQRLALLNDATRSGLEELAERLSCAVTARRGLAWTRCHGDCHGFNARIALAGPHAGRAVFFDFDDGGPGYLAYDLAVFLWARVSFQRKEHAMWHAFVEGYRSVRALAEADYEAARLFVAIRHIWLMGEYASRITEWGSELVPADFVARELEFMRTWELTNLAPALL
jgi:Ser/Thr protein kinase RdoA (MazF antagonist)